MKKSISCVFVVIIALLYYSVHSMPNIVNSYAQNNTGPQTTTTPTQAPTTFTPGVKITTPVSNEQISLQNNSNNKTIQLTGTSTDNTTIDCRVSIIANDIKPYQNTTATGPGGENDYSAWTYFLAPPLFKEGSNKVTARISCMDSSIEPVIATSGSMVNMMNTSTMDMEYNRIPSASRIVNISNYQNAQGLAIKALEIFRDDLKPLKLSNTTRTFLTADIRSSLVSGLEEGLSLLVNSIDEKKPYSDIMQIIHGPVHTNLFLAYDLKMMAE